MRVTVADDHQIIRVGLRSILQAEPDMEVVGEATNAREALDLIGREKPDVAILDLNLPDSSGLSIVPAILTSAPNTRILVLTMHSEPQVIRSALSVGVHGFLNKAAEPEEVVRAVRSVAQGRGFVSVPLEAGGLIDLVARDGGSSPLTTPKEAGLVRDSGRPISEREREILALFARGLTHRQIAEELGLRVKTVETYRSRLGDRFGARSRADLVRCAREMGLLDAPKDEP
jgi:two-component system response regulator NreC